MVAIDCYAPRVSIPSLDIDSGRLPRSRHVCDEASVKARFVDHPDFGDSTTRKNIWGEFESSRELIQSITRIHSIWFAGSFISNKIEPSDIDVTFIINALDYESAPDEDRVIVESFARLARPPHGNKYRTSGFKLVDSFLIPWKPIPDLDPEHGGVELSYCSNRGYWDDFWLRERSGSKEDPLVAEDSFPRRGYLEVNIDAYSA